MKRFYLLLVLAITPFLLHSQNISVKSFKLLPNDLDARVTFPKVDQNGEKCAIIKVVTTETGFTWDGDMLGIIAVEKKTGEYWLYIPHGAKRLTIKHDKIGVLRDYPYPEAIQKTSVYEMVISTVKATSSDENQPSTQFVVITSLPEGADVYINDLHKGTTPFQQEMSEGEYDYRVEKAFYYTEAGKFSLTAASGKKELTINFKPNFGYAEIISLPESGMNVFVDGVPLAKTTPVTTERLKSGKHTISVSKALYHEQSREITISDNQTLKVEFNVLAAFGSINIESKPETGCSVLIDGIETGKETPCRLEQVVTGEHTITLHKEWFEPHSVNVRVTDGKEANVPVELQPTFGTVKITSDSQSEILIDNQSKGYGNWEGRLIAGWHTLEARKNIHHPATQKVELMVGATKEITLTPKPMYGNLKVMANAIGATIKLNGKDYGETPAIINNLFMGDYTLTLEKQGFGTLTKTISIKDNVTTDLNEILSTGMSVAINSDPAGVSLTVDGNPSGTTPQNLTLGFGSHLIKLVNGKMIVEDKINLSQNSKTIFSYDVRETADILITSNPSNAKVYINNEYKGTTPLTTETKVGINKIRVTKNSDYLDSDKDVMINGNTNLPFELIESPSKETNRISFINKLYKKNSNQKYIFIESLFYHSRTLMFYRRNNTNFIKLPPLYKSTFFFSDLNTKTITGSLFISVDAFGETQLSKSYLYYDIVSVSLGYLFFSFDHKNKFSIEGKLCLGMDFGIAPQKYYYNGKEIVYWGTYTGIDGQKEYSYSGTTDNIVPGMIKCTFERHLFNKSFLVLSAGALINYISSKDQWYYKSDIDIKITNGNAPDPLPITAPDLPADRWPNKTLAPFIGVGIRF